MNCHPSLRKGKGDDATACFVWIGREILKALKDELCAP